MAMTFCEKKVTASSVEQKQNRSENLKQHYVAFQFPSNRIKNIASSFFLRKNFAFIHRVAAFTLSVPDSDT